jgi:hypothetical protein
MTMAQDADKQQENRAERQDNSDPQPHQIGSELAKVSLYMPYISPPPDFWSANRDRLFKTSQSRFEPSDHVFIRQLLTDCTSIGVKGRHLLWKADWIQSRET